MDRRTVLKGLSLGLPTFFAACEAGAMSNTAFFVPPEDAPHELTFMQWPASRKVYSDRWFLRALQATILRLANTIAAFEPVILLADPALHGKIRPRLASGVTLWDIPTEDLWARDSGPITARVPHGQRRVSHIRFNGWGGKQLHRLDAQIAQACADRLGLPLHPSPLSGEAGAVEQDGHGLLIAHESSWVNPNRNPSMTRAQIEAALLEAYGASRMLWAPGLRGEDITDYHIDSLVRLTGPGRALINLPKHPDPRDPFHRAAEQTMRALRSAGLEFDVIPEPEMRRVTSPDFVASYANFYVCNGTVIAPEFGDSETDAQAARALARHYPDREVVTLNVDEIGEVGGGIHCATHELPAA